MTAATLERLSALIREEGGLLAGALLAGGPRVPAQDPGLASLTARGPRAREDPGRLALAVEAAYEGLLLHRGRSRVLDAGDPDLALLAGDRLYALSLATLADAGHVDAVRELADVISLCARAQAEDTPDLERAAWDAAATAIGWGPDARLEEAKDAARVAGASAAGTLHEAAETVRAQA